MLESFRLSLSSFKETADPAAVLCHFCAGQALKILKLQDDIKKIKESIQGDISKLTVIDATTPHRTKRLSTSNVASKRARLIVDHPVTSSQPTVPVATPSVTESSSSVVKSPSVTVSDFFM